MRRSGTRRGSLGQSATEFLVIFPAVIFLVLGAIQWGLIYQARATLNHAALLAARSGALHHGSKAEMRKGLAAGLAPLFAHEASMAGYVAARAKAGMEISLARLAVIDVVNPTPEAFVDFSAPRLDGLSPGDRELPNDTLSYRNPAPGRASGMSIQDANLLHIRVTYCYRMIVPVVGKLINTVANALTPFDPALQSQGMSDPFGIGDSPVLDPCWRPLVDGPRIRIQSQAVVRMQSPYFRSNL